MVCSGNDYKLLKPERFQEARHIYFLIIKQILHEDVVFCTKRLLLVRRAWDSKVAFKPCCRPAQPISFEENGLAATRV